MGDEPRGGDTNHRARSRPGKRSHAARRDSMERALVYMDLKPGMPLEGIAISFHQLVHQ
jgi:hypothetical protein